MKCYKQTLLVRLYIWCKHNDNLIKCMLSSYKQAQVIPYAMCTLEAMRIEDGYDDDGDGDDGDGDDDDDNDGDDDNVDDGDFTMTEDDDDDDDDDKLRSI